MYRSFYGTGEYLQSTPEGKKFLADRGLWISEDGLRLHYKDKSISFPLFESEIMRLNAKIENPFIESTQSEDNIFRIDKSIRKTFKPDVIKIFDDYLKEIGFAE